jgi:hypothetical protein
VKAIFTDARYRGTLDRVVKYIELLDREHSDRSYERVTRANVITEAFFIEMGTVDAYRSEVELMIAIRGHAAGEIADKSIKVYLQKYIEAHTFVYEYRDGLTRQRHKSGDGSRTRGDVPLYYLTRGLDDGHVCNRIQAMLRIEITKLRGHASYRISRL